MLARSLRSVKSAARSLYDFIYPPTCLACERSLSGNEQRISAACWIAIRPVSSSDPLFLEMSERLMSTGIISGLASAFHFEKNGTLQHLIHQLKYNDLPGIGIDLGKHVGGRIAALLDGVSNVRLIPVPLHPLKQRERGYNQSDYIAKGASFVTGLEILPSVLRRRKKTRSQTQLSLAERQDNVNDAFHLTTGNAAVRDASIVIIDDVITTGATIHECARVLKEHGALHVYAASIALADHATVDIV